MNSLLLEKIGRCVIACQSIELGLCILLIMEREKNIPKNEDVFDFIEQLSSLRSGKVLPSLKKEIEDQKVNYLDSLPFAELIKRRNHLVHCFIHDSRFLAAIESNASDFIEEYMGFFSDFLAKVEQILRSRAKELGVYISDEIKTHPEDIISFGGALQKRIDLLNEQKSRRR
jgi:hypothetical protein